MQFIVSEDIFEKLPNACFGCVAVQGADNREKRQAIEDLLAANVARCEAELDGLKVKELPDILYYRDAFRAVGINPNKFMCSIESLLTRIAKKKGFPAINGLVDLGNAVSVGCRIPIGAHDIDSFADGTLELRPAGPEDTFVAFGETETETPDPGEPVYVSGHTVRTRRWAWRQSEIGKITEDTTSVFFPIDGFTDVNLPEVLRARDEIAALLKQHFGCTAEVGLVDREHPVFTAFT